MKNFKFKINGNDYAVHIANIEDNIAEVEVNGTPYRVEMDKELKQTKTPKLVRPDVVPHTDTHPSVVKTVGRGSPSSGTVKSPLPGVIMDIMVQPGDEVEIGQRILVLEAMKMENNIESDKAGRVAEVKVRRGDSVLEGDVLITIA